jgi:predicted Zn-ribbon and HTH transcriptional regulator
MNFPANGTANARCDMGPTKVISKDHALVDVKTGKVIKEGLTTRKEEEAYAAHHYIALPVIDNGGRTWLLNGMPVYRLHGSRYETVDDKVVHLTRCPDCGGMALNQDEPTMERDVIRCTQCGHEFESRLEMMES